MNCSIKLDEIASLMMHRLVEIHASIYALSSRNVKICLYFSTRFYHTLIRMSRSVSLMCGSGDFRRGVAWQTARLMLYLLRSQDLDLFSSINSIDSQLFIFIENVTNHW